MSQSAESQPLSRRERRLRDLAETGVIPTIQSEDADTAVASELSDFEPNISPIHPDGTIRSRREIRELREQAIAEHLAEELESTQAYSATELSEAHASLDEVESVEADVVVAEAGEANVEASVEELDPIEEEVKDDVVSAETKTDEVDMDGTDVHADDTDVDVEEIAADDAEADYVDAQHSGESVSDIDLVEEAAAADAAAELEAIELENVDSTDTEAELEVEAVPESEVDLDAEESADESEIATVGGFAAKAAVRDSYSFPDIAPLDDSASVFDTPNSPSALRAADPGEQSDFDDLITSAVAQEGSGSATNTSALILPNMGHTGGLSGPLGETGELFITGSFELPKSLGETGGHARLLDSGSEDADEIAATAFGSTGDDGGMAPVSATKAVSARTTGALVSSPTTEKSRLPAVLIATGGGLIVIIAGLAVWAASTGFFV